MVILGLRNRPSLANTTEQQDEWSQLMSQLGGGKENQSLEEAKQSVDYALASGTSVRHIEESINSQRASLIADGVDPDELIRYLYRQRPWWQRMVDILPGRQFR